MGGRHYFFTFHGYCSHHDVLTASNSDVKLAKFEPYILHDFKSSFCFERKNKLDRDDSYWQILLFVYPLEYNVTRIIDIIPSILRQSRLFFRLASNAFPDIRSVGRVEKKKKT